VVGTLLGVVEVLLGLGNALLAGLLLPRPIGAVGVGLRIDRSGGGGVRDAGVPLLPLVFIVFSLLITGGTMFVLEDEGFVEVSGCAEVVDGAVEAVERSWGGAGCLLSVAEVLKGLGGVPVELSIKSTTGNGATMTTTVLLPPLLPTPPPPTPDGSTGLAGSGAEVVVLPFAGTIMSIGDSSSGLG